MTHLELKHLERTSELNDLPRLQPPSVAITTVLADSTGRTRGLVRHEKDDVDHEMAGVEGLEAARLGWKMYFRVKAPFAGYAHLFDFNLDGDIEPLVPKDLGPAPHIAAHTWIDLRPRTLPAWTETGDSSRRANGYPERLVVVVTRDQISLEAGVFTPQIVPGETSGGGFGAIQDRRSPLSRLPRDDWAWGRCEFRVE